MRFATALPPRLHYYEGFNYPLRDLPQRDHTHRNYNLVYTRLEHTTPPLNLLHKRQHKANWDYKALGVPTRSQILSLTTSYKVKYEVRLKKLSERRNSVRKNRGVSKLTENSFKKKELEDSKLEKLFSFETNLKTCVFFLKTKNNDSYI